MTVLASFFLSKIQFIVMYASLDPNFKTTLLAITRYNKPRRITS